MRESANRISPLSFCIAFDTIYLASCDSLPPSARYQMVLGYVRRIWPANLICRDYPF
jgi:hypothetical protein